MALSITHTKVSAIADVGDASLVEPSDWNAAHTLTGTISIAQGGTNQTAFTSNAINYFDGTSVASMSGTSWDDTNRSLTLTGATVTTSNPVLNLSQTWNAGAVTFTGLKLNVTNTASAAASLLIDLQVGAASKFNVDESGNVTASTINSGIGIGATDALLFRDAAGILAQRNSTNAQTLRVYNTFTDASNYERGVFDWTTTANTLTIGTQKAGTGTARNLQFVVGGLVMLDYGVSNANQFSFATGFTFNGSNSIVSSGGTLLFQGLDVGIVPGQIKVGTGGGYGLTLGTDAYVSAVDTQLSRSAAGVAEINNGTVGTIAGCYLHWGGQARVTSNVTSSSTSLANVTGLSATLANGRTYSFEAELIATCSSSGGIRLTLNTTSTSTGYTLLMDGYAIDSGNTVRGYSQQTTIGTVVIGSTITNTSLHASLRGTITTSSSMVVNIQMCQQNLSATQTIAQQGSYMYVHDMP